MMLVVGAGTGFLPPAASKLATRTRAAVSRDVRMETPVPPEALALGKQLCPPIGYYDPLRLATADFWDKGNEFTWGWLRHAEIKHGRVAMAGFVGYLVQSSGAHWPFPLQGGGAEQLQYTAGLSPPEQWDALTLEARIQIVLFVGFLEWWSEFAPAMSGGKHYAKGGKPGFYPPFDDRKGDNRIGNGFGWPNPFPVPSLYQPLGPANFFPNPLSGSGGKAAIPTEEELARGRLMEINNGRLAMIGIMGFLAEAKVPGSVPALSGIVKPYAGEVMSPFEAVTVAAEVAKTAAEAVSAAL